MVLISFDTSIGINVPMSVSYTHILVPISEIRHKAFQSLINFDT